MVFIASKFEGRSIPEVNMPPQPRASQPFGNRRQYGPDPASAVAIYHLDEENAQLSSSRPRQDTEVTSRAVSHRLQSTGNNFRAHDSGNASQPWFDRLNTTVGEPQLSMDGEPPFHPRGLGSSSSDLSSETNVPSRQTSNRIVATFAQHGNTASTEKTDSGDYRSIIDDLTVENRELKERVGRYEAAMAQSAQVQQDRLFEVKVHGLPSHRKRELIETLKAFAEKDDVLKETQSSQYPAVGASTPYVSVNRSVLPYGQLSQSPSGERLDSTYASASASGQLSTSTLDHKNPSSKKESRQQIAETLDGTPAGLLYKGYDPSMTDREKKIMVVKRLELLFSGKGGRHSRSTKAGPATDGQIGFDHITERIREAQILPSIEESHNDIVAQGGEMIMEDHSTSQHEADHEQASARTGLSPSPQRETRPLDVDPDRIQIPQENIKYIRHLGMSSKFTGDETSDMVPILGWVYLNLLFNLAQLHIFNVTPDFVRTAITEVSTSFELSADRQMVQWHGGPVDTKVCSDSEGDRAMRDATTDSSDSGSKRRKLGDSTSTDIGGQNHNYGHSKTASSSKWHGSARGRRRYDLDYKPLFVKPAKSTGRAHYHDDAASGYLHRSTIDGDACGSAPGTMMTHGTNYSHARSDSGPIVFFSGAHFVTDLSGDQRDAIVQDQPPYFQFESKKASITPLGADRPKRPRPKLTRSDSGSRIRTRPFKDYSKCAEMLQQDSRLKTPEPTCSDDAHSNDISFDPKWTDDDKAASPQQRILMEASGIGGTKPDDNFVVIVETAHPKMRSEFHKQLQAQVAASLDPDRKTAKLLHMIEEAKLDPVQLSKRAKGKQPALPNPSLQPPYPPVKITVLSKRELRLPPSETPPPAQLWNEDSDSDEDFEDYDMESSCTDREIHFLKNSPQDTQLLAHEDESEHDDNDDGDESEGSIDMMAADRKLNPSFVGEREVTFERELRMMAAGEGAKGSGSQDATIGDEQEKDGSTAEEGEAEEGDDSGDEDEDESMSGW